MIKKEEELKRLIQDVTEFIEDGIKIIDKNGMIVEFKLTRIQKNILAALIRNGCSNLRTLYITKQGEKK